MPATDLYAFGCIAYEVLTGSVLFGGSTPTEVARTHDRGPVFLKDLLSEPSEGVDERPQVTAPAEPLARLGRYNIVGELGRGGFATVYRAMDSQLSREVALKVLHPQLLVDTSFVRRFEQEAQAMARLRHPAIIKMYDVGKEQGRLYIAMELAPRGSLARMIGDRGRIPWSETLGMLQPIAAALDYAHGQGVIHRDLTPSTILLDERSRPLLSDFSLAAVMSIGESTLTPLTEGMAGTPSYVAPEIWNKNAPSPASDLYALGCIVYEMLMGAKLFPGATPLQILYAHTRGPRFPATWPSGVPSGVAEVLGRAIAEKPTARHPSATAFWQALADLGPMDASQPEDATTGTEAPKPTGLRGLWRRLRGQD